MVQMAVVFPPQDHMSMFRQGVCIFLLVCQSIHGLCGTSQDNPMMIGFLGDEMTLKTTLLVWEPMVTSNGLVSWVIGSDKRFQPLMTSNNTGVFFSTKVNLYYHTNSFSIKHVDAP